MPPDERITLSSASTCKDTNDTGGAYSGLHADVWRMCTGNAWPTRDAEINSEETLVTFLKRDRNCITGSR
jgi:hypothetical protein